ncbi:MAG TPA: glycosyltransferase family 39 protein [Polyangiales bacterium]|nr:glycosyltransferase family 39 protein [Polyangiales bacterium]
MNSQELRRPPAYPVAVDTELSPPRDSWRALAWIGLFALIALAFVCGPTVGLTWDEPLQLRYGNRILSWYRSGFTNGAALTYAAPLYEYGGLFEAPAQFIAWLLPFEPTSTRHVLTGLCAVLGISAAWKIAERLGGTRAGFCAAALLALTPAWWGHGMFNSKDIPFAAAAAWTLYGSIDLLLGPSPARWRNLLLAALATGAALGVRAGGMFLLAYPALALAARAVIERSPIARQPRRLLLRAAAFVGVAWLVMLSAWPWAQLSPIARPLQVAQSITHFAWNGDMLFRGALINAGNTPSDYLPTWFAITLPEIYFATWACALLLACYALARRERAADTTDRRRLVAYGLIGFATFAPLAAAMLLRPVLYDGQRHFLFLLPPLAAGSGLLLSRFLGASRVPSTLRAGAAVVLIALAGLTFRDMLSLHPYEYVYFNRLAGGLHGAADRFETDYWGASYREGLQWVVNHVQPEPGQRLQVASCACFHETKHFIDDIAHAAASFEVVRDPAQADIFLLGSRRGCPAGPGRVLHSVERQGVTLLRVIQRP